MNEILIVLGIIAVGSFVIGSIPFGVILNRIFGGKNLRQVGSGSTGATNVYRSSGKFAGLLTVVFDAGKAVGAVVLACLLLEYQLDDMLSSVVGFIANNFFSTELGLLKFVAVFIAGFFAVLGHCYSPFLRFKGGKGVATSLGFIAIFNWQIAVITFGVWLLVFLFTRYVSVSSIMASVAVPVAVLFMEGDYNLEKAGAFCLLTLFVVFRHRENIRRLKKGEENRISFSKKKNDDDAK